MDRRILSSDVPISATVGAAESTLILTPKDIIVGGGDLLVFIERIWTTRREQSPYGEIIISQIGN